MKLETLFGASSGYSTIRIAGKIRYDRLVKYYTEWTVFSLAFWVFFIGVQQIRHRCHRAFLFHNTQNVSHNTYAICWPLLSKVMRVQVFPSLSYISSLAAACSLVMTSPVYSTTTSPLSISRLAKAQAPAALGSLRTLWICENANKQWNILIPVHACWFYVSVSS